MTTNPRAKAAARALAEATGISYSAARRRLRQREGSDGADVGASPDPMKSPEEYAQDGADRVVGVAVSDPRILELVMVEAAAFGASTTDVAMLDDGAWARFDALVYDETEVGGDTVETLRYLDAMFVSADSMTSEFLPELRARVSNYLANVFAEGILLGNEYL